jgi:hypothetical protein
LLNDQVGFLALGQIPLRLDDRLSDGLNVLGTRSAAQFSKDLFGQQQIDVVAAEMGVAVGGEHLEDTVFHPQYRDVEGPAAKIVHGDDASMALVQPVGERRRGRLVDDPQDLETGDASRVAGGSPLRVVEVRRHGDHRTIDIRVDVPLGREILFGAALELSEDECGDLRRREFPVAQTDSHDSGRVSSDFEGKLARFIPHIVEALAHEAFDGVHRAPRLRHQPALCFAADVDGAVRRYGYDRRKQSIAGTIANHDRSTILDDRHEAVRRAQVDADYLAHAVNSLAIPSRRLLM